MKSTRYLPELKRLRGEVQRSASKGERILGSLFPNRGVGFPGGWSQDRVEQSLHLRNWVYVAVDLICSKLASVFPNVAYVTDQEKPGHTVKAGRRGLLNVTGRGFGGSPYVGPGYDYDGGFGVVAGEYVGTDGWRGRTVWDGDRRGHVHVRHDGNPQPAFGGMNGSHSFLTVGEYVGKALSVVKPHEELEPLEAGHMLRRLIQNPNSYDTYFSYTYEKWMFGELCGVHYEWLVPGPWGKPAERWVIPSHWVWPRTGGGRVPDGGARDRMRRNGATTYEWDPGQEVGDAARYRAAYVPYDNPYADRLIQYYEVRPWGGMGSAGVLRIPPNEIVMTRWPSPVNKIDGYSKLAAVAQWIDTEESISKSRWSQFQNQARPEFWVQLPPGYDDADDNRIARIEAKFANKFLGETNYGKPIFTSAGTLVTPLSFNPQEMAYFQSEDQVRDMTLSTWRVPPAAVGIVKEMTFGSILATLASLCTYCFNPRLTMSGETDTKFLASRWDDATPAYSSGYSVLGEEDRDRLYEGTVLDQGGGVTTRGNGGAASERKTKIFYDDCVPADPSQVNSDLETDGHFYAVTPNEVRALRGRKPYRYGGDNPIVQGPAGPMPLPLNDREEELDELAQLAQPMATLGQEEGQQPGQEQGASAPGQEQGSPQLTNGSANGLAGQGEDGDESTAPPSAGGHGRPLSPDRYQQDFEDEMEDSGAIENPNGKPHKSYRNGVVKAFTWEGVRLTLPLTTLATADFVRLPDGVEGTNCMNCRYQSQGQCWFPDLAGQEVNERTCCKFWDAPGTGRPWQQGAAKGHQWVHPGVRLRSFPGKAVDPETGDPLEELPAGRKDPIKIHLPELRQGTNYSCGASALQAVCEFFGVGPQEEGAFIKLLPSDPDNGTDPSKVIALAHKLGLDVAAHQGMRVEDVKRLVGRGQPVMVLVQAWYSDYNKADLASDDDGHYVAVIGYDQDKLYFADPAVKGARSELPYAEFLERWHDEGGDGRPYVRYGIAFWRPSYAEPMKGVKSNDGAGLGQVGTAGGGGFSENVLRRAGGGGDPGVADGQPARPGNEQDRSGSKRGRKVAGPRNLLGVK